MSDIRRRRSPRRHALPFASPTGELGKDSTRLGMAIGLTGQCARPQEEQDLFAQEEIEATREIDGLPDEERSTLPAEGNPAGNWRDDPVELLPQLSGDYDELLDDEDESEVEGDSDSSGALALWPEALYATDLHGNPLGQPMPAIEINEFGEVIVLLSDHLDRCRDSRTLALLDLYNQIGMGTKRSEFLRACGEGIVNKNSDELLYGPPSIVDAKLKPMTQKEVFSAFTIPANSTAILKNTCVRTPLWGVVPLSAFFETDEWDLTIEEVRREIEKESVEYPDKIKKNSSTWKTLSDSRPHLGKLVTNRMLLNKMVEYDIPVAPGRKNIYDSVKRWRRTHKSSSEIATHAIPDLVQELMDHFGLFRSESTERYREERFKDFTEKRVIKILKVLGIQVI